MTPDEYADFIRRNRRDLIGYIEGRWGIKNGTAEDVLQQVLEACSRPANMAKIDPSRGSVQGAMKRLIDNRVINEHEHDTYVRTAQALWPRDTTELMRYSPEQRHQADYHACREFVRCLALHHAIEQLPPPYPTIVKEVTLKDGNLSRYGREQGWSAKQFERYARGLRRHLKTLRPKIEQSLEALGWDEYH